MLGLTGNYEVICDAYYNLKELDSALYYGRKGLSIAKIQNQKEYLLKLNLIILVQLWVIKMQKISNHLEDSSKF